MPKRVTVQFLEGRGRERAQQVGRLPEAIGRRSYVVSEGRNAVQSSIQAKAVDEEMVDAGGSRTTTTGQRHSCCKLAMKGRGLQWQCDSRSFQSRHTRLEEVVRAANTDRPVDFWPSL